MSNIKNIRFIIALCFILISIFALSFLMKKQIFSENVPSGSNNTSKNFESTPKIDEPQITDKTENLKSETGIEESTPSKSSYIEENLKLQEAIPKNIDEASGLKYEETEDWSNKKVDTYVDNEGREYLYGNEDRKLVGFYDYSNSHTLNEIYIQNEDNLKIIAYNFLKNYIKIDNYTFLKHTYDEYAKVHSFEYSIVIQGYKSSDFAYVDIRNDGTIKAFAFTNAGLFEGIKIPKINETEMIKTFEKMIKEKYKFVKYEIDYKTLTLSAEKKCEMSIGFILTFDDGIQCGYSINVPLE